MVALIVIGSILLFFLILLFSPVKFLVRYDGELVAKIRYLFLTISLAPSKPKPEGKPPKKKKPKPKPKKQAKKKSLPGSSR